MVKFINWLGKMPSFSKISRFDFNRSPDSTHDAGNCCNCCAGIFLKIFPSTYNWSAISKALGISIPCKEATINPARIRWILALPSGTRNSKVWRLSPFLADTLMSGIGFGSHVLLPCPSKRNTHQSRSGYDRPSIFLLVPPDWAPIGDRDVGMVLPKAVSASANIQDTGQSFFRAVCDNLPFSSTTFCPIFFDQHVKVKSATGFPRQ